jgi:hypothetical protein
LARAIGSAEVRRYRAGITGLTGTILMACRW